LRQVQDLLPMVVAVRGRVGMLTRPRCMLILPRCMLTLPRCMLILPRCNVNPTPVYVNPTQAPRSRWWRTRRRTRAWCWSRWWSSTTCGGTR
jgi:hypothetical protein